MTPHPITRAEALEQIKLAVLQDRQVAYGPPEDSFGLIADLWSSYLSRHKQGALKPHDVAALMMLLKVARIAYAPHSIDSWVDAGGYAVCGSELAPSPEQPELNINKVSDSFVPVAESKITENLTTHGKEVCNLANARLDSDPLTAAEQQAAFILARILMGATLARSEDHLQIISKAYRNFNALTIGEFIKLLQIAQ